LALIFCGNELIVQCTANIDDEAAAVNILKPAMENYQSVKLTCASSRFDSANQFQDLQ
jgi:hypothetical protein